MSICIEMKQMRGFLPPGISYPKYPCHLKNLKSLWISFNMHYCANMKGRNLRRWKATVKVEILLWLPMSALILMVYANSWRPWPFTLMAIWIMESRRQSLEPGHSKNLIRGPLNKAEMSPTKVLLSMDREMDSGEGDSTEACLYQCWH